MGGGKSEKETKTTIRNEISAELSAKVNNFTKNVNETITKNTMSVSNEMVNEFKNKSNAEALASNMLEDVVIVASKGAKIDITQDASAKLEMAAIVNILSSNEQKNDLANKVSAAMENAVKNDSKLKAQMTQAAKLDKKTKDSGGFAKMIDGIMGSLGGMMKDLSGGSSKSSSETDIRNSIKTKVETEINNTTINENKFVSEMSAEIKNSFKNMTEDECLGSAQSRNMARKLKLMADEGAEIRVMQVAKTDVIAKCISTKKIGNKALTGITNDAAFKAASTTGNKAKVDASSKQKGALSDLKETRDAISDTVGDLGKELGETARTGIKEVGKTTRMGMGVILLPIILIGGVVAIFVIMKIINSNDLSEEDDEDMEGGFNMEALNKLLDVPLAKRGLTLIVAFFVIDMILKKIRSKN